MLDWKTRAGLPYDDSDVARNHMKIYLYDRFGMDQESIAAAMVDHADLLGALSQSVVPNPLGMVAYALVKAIEVDRDPRLQCAYHQNGHKKST